jgi:hypothetical protein
MNRRLIVSLITAGVAAASGVASANASYWRDNGLLLEVSADPRDGTDFVQTNPTHATSLELVALNDNVRLRGMTVHFSDGRTFSHQMQTIRPGEHVRVDLPANCGLIQSVDLDYGRQVVDRTTARLQIIPKVEQRYEQPRYAYQPPVYQRPVYQQPVYQQPVYPSRPVRATTYTVRPRATLSGSIQGYFRF